MFYYLYQITNNLNGKIYVGVHKTLNLDDGYMGSGKVIKRAIEKHGLENFKKDILEFFKTSDEMYNREKEIVTEDFLNRKDTYNLRRGGNGGFDFINKNPSLFLTEKRLGALWSIEKRRQQYLFKFYNDEQFRSKHEEHLKRIRQIWMDKYPEGTFKGKTHTVETKQRMSEIAKERLKDPTKNSQFGTMWITDGITNQKISKESPIPLGWTKGRMIRKEYSDR